jgi:hypothetical protein
MKGLWPLAVVGAVLVFLWVAICFKWVGPNLTGSVPNLFVIVAPAFVAWGFYFAAGTGTPALVKVIVGSVFGVVAGYLLMLFASKPTGDGLGAAAVAGVLGLILIFCIAISDKVFVPASFGAFASVVMVWEITGLANYLPADAKGTFGPQMDIASVALNVLIGCIIGAALGLIHTTVAASITPKGQKADEAHGVEEIVDR